MSALSLPDRYEQALAAFTSTGNAPVSPGSGMTPDLVDLPSNSPPPGHRNFNQPGVIALPAIGAGETSVVSLTVPLGWGGGVINYIANTTNVGGFIDGSGALIWRVRLNHNQYVKNYDKVLVRLGVPPFPGDTNIILVSGDFIEWTVTNISQVGGGAQVMCFLRGWFWPVQSS
jgi:hypothetical protein